MTVHTVRTNSADDTRNFAAHLGSLLRGGDIICLIGDLGAGKTTFTQGLGLGLRLAADDLINSPTFTILSEHHSGPVPLYHFDVYRLPDASGLYDLAFDEYLDGGGVTVIEWADRILAALPNDYLEITFVFMGGTDERLITLAAHGARSQDILAALSNGTPS